MAYWVSVSGPITPPLHYSMPTPANFLHSLVGSMSQGAAGNPTVAMIEAAFRHHGLHWRYVNMEVAPADLAAAVTGARAMGFRGFNLSMPHKVAVIPHLDTFGASWRGAGIDGLPADALLVGIGERTAVVFEDGGQLRDFIWVGDCVSVMLWLLDHPNVNGLFNLGTGQARSFKDLISAMYRALSAEPKLEYVDMPEKIRGQYQYFTESKVDNLRRAGYNAGFTPLEDGVKRYVTQFLDTSDRYR